MALVYLKNENDALEAIQEVTFRAYHSIGKLREPAYFSSWLIRIMLNYCNDTRRNAGRFIFDEQILLAQKFTADYSLIELEDAMFRLASSQRDIIILKYFQDLKIRDIAFIMQCPESTAKTRLYKALKMLRSKLEEKGEPGHV
ncbi:RNA polymerase subunit sigma-70 [Bacillus sp. M6-12]|nr:RNA polymerase subunit sigma-70 [Bacillus sp. M6-12]